MTNGVGQGGSAQRTGSPAGGDISVVDSALWLRFSDETDLSEFIAVWLALLVRQFGDVKEAVVILPSPNADGFEPAGIWPPRHELSNSLMLAAEVALSEGKGAVEEASLATPLERNGECAAVIGVTLGSAEAVTRPEALRGLKWGAGWLLSALRWREELERGRKEADTSSIFDLLGVVSDAEDFATACMSAVNSLARTLNADAAAIGLRAPTAIKLHTISDVTDFRFNTDATLAMRDAMQEAVDQDTAIIYPQAEEGGYVINMCHQRLATNLGDGKVLTLCLYEHAEAFGALQMTRAGGSAFSDEEIVLAEASAAVLGRLLADKRKAERNPFGVIVGRARQELAHFVGPDHLKRKIAAALILGVTAFLAIVPGDFRVVSQAEIQGATNRFVVAPYDGYIFEEFARAGDVVEEGEPLARLDERDLRIELLRWQTDLQRYRAEYERALADKDAAVAGIAGANVAQSQAKVDLVSSQLDRATLRAPFTAKVIEGDLSRSIGAAVRRGEGLFQIAQLDKYRVSVEVEERHLDEIEIGQKGKLVLSALPSLAFDIEVTQITYLLQSGDGRNFAIIEAQVDGGDGEIRPGMRGVAKIQIERRPLLSIWLQPVSDWVRLTFWRWGP